MDGWRGGDLGELTLRGVCVCESRLMKWFVTSLMTKGTRFHRHGITDVKTNLAPLQGFKGSFVTGAPPDKVGDLIENPSPFVARLTCWGD